MKINNYCTLTKKITIKKKLKNFLKTNLDIRDLKMIKWHPKLIYNFKFMIDIKTNFKKKIIRMSKTIIKQT